MRDAILKALGELDAGNDAHWTASGLPSMAELERRVDESSITREQVTDIAPDFTRKRRVLPDDAPPVDAAQAGAGNDNAETGPALTFRVGRYLISTNAPGDAPDTQAEHDRAKAADALPDGCRYGLDEYGERQRLIGEVIKALTEELKVLGAEQ